jgi:hypothetical protein
VSDSSDSRPAKYDTIVYPANRHEGYGTPVTVYADNVRAARARAIRIGWGGDPGDARVAIKSVHDTESAPQIEVEPDSGLDPARRCTCGHLIREHRGNYSGSRACDHCSCPSYPT